MRPPRDHRKPQHSDMPFYSAADVRAWSHADLDVRGVRDFRTWLKGFDRRGRLRFIVTDVIKMNPKVVFSPGFVTNDATGQPTMVKALDFLTKEKAFSFVADNLASVQLAYNSALEYYERVITAAGWKGGQIENQHEVFDQSPVVANKRKERLICLPRDDHRSIASVLYNSVATEADCCSLGSQCHGTWKTGDAIYVFDKGHSHCCDCHCMRRYRDNHYYDTTVHQTKEPVAECREGCPEACKQLGIQHEDHHELQRESDVCMWTDSQFNKYVGELKREVFHNGFESALAVNAELIVQNSLLTPAGTGSAGASWIDVEKSSLIQFRSEKQTRLTQRILELRLQKLRLIGRCELDGQPEEYMTF